ncbi:MAG TPA: hypothetical protein VNN76_06915 [Bacteroidota bacterium]|nr:hypothetical protein [Bacteroidota bacterium]
MRPWWMWKIAKLLVVGVVAIVVFGAVVMLLWNALIPDLFKGPEITFWQAAGLLVLSHLLLRGWAPWRYGNGWRRERWKRRFEEKLAAMTPEEREKFKEEWKRKCGWYPGMEEDEKKRTNA